VLLGAPSDRRQDRACRRARQGGEPHRL